MIKAELEQNLPILDNSYECVYCREVLEHLSYYEKTISEMIRISSKEVIIVWFIIPDNEEHINYWEEEDLYHNKYEINKLEKFITSIDKVDNLFWEFVEDLTNRKDVVDELHKESSINEHIDEQIEMVEIPFVKIQKAILHIILKE